MHVRSTRRSVGQLYALSAFAFLAPLAAAQESTPARESPRQLQAQTAYQPCAVEPVSMPSSGGTCCPTPCCPTQCCPTPCCGTSCPRPGYFRVIPYAWLPGFEGDLGIRSRTAPVDVSIGKVWDVLIDTIDIGGMGQVEASNGVWGAIFNGMYVDISPTSNFRNLEFDTDLRITLADLVATYQPQWLTDVLPAGGRLELLAGARYYALSSNIAITRQVERTGPLGRTFVRERTVSAGGTEDWVDAVVGARARLPLTQRLTGQVRGDVGGFGISGSSDFAWNVEAILEYRCSSCLSLFGGWRWLDVDYTHDSSNGRFTFDMNLSGPMLGLALNF